jgi:hypothetical protein
VRGLRFAEQSGRRLYFIYNYKRGHVVPVRPGRRPAAALHEAELQLRAKLGTELPVEPELERWFPLWGTPI